MPLVRATRERLRTGLGRACAMEELQQWKLDLPGIPHKLLNEPLEILVNFYKEHMRRDIDAGRLTPPDPWVLLRGLLLAAMQTYASICILLADRRPKRLMLQAAVLNRTLFEIMATVVAVTEDPMPRERMLAKDYYRTLALTYAHRAKRFGCDTKWAEYLEVFRAHIGNIAQRLALGPELVQDPKKIEEWPTPSVMVRGRPNKGIAPFVSGTRLLVLEEIWKFHYGGLSAQAHGRMSSVAAAVLVDDASLQWNPGYSESDIVLVALLFMACALSEIESTGGFEHHPKLAELWSYLREAHDEAKELWHLRYKELSAGAIPS
jgi:hypothetical protein